MVSMMLKTNLALVRRYVDDVEDDIIDQTLYELHTLLLMLDGVPSSDLEDVGYYEYDIDGKVYAVGV